MTDRSPTPSDAMRDISTHTFDHERAAAEGRLYSRSVPAEGGETPICSCDFDGSTCHVHEWVDGKRHNRTPIPPSAVEGPASEDETGVDTDAMKRVAGLIRPYLKYPTQAGTVAFFLLSEIAALRSQVEQLTKERDEARESDSSARDALDRRRVRVEQMEKALRLAMEWAAGYPLGGAGGVMDRAAANAIYDTITEALVSLPSDTSAQSKGNIELHRELTEQRIRDEKSDTSGAKT
jgi:hypothetical protein